MKFSLQDGLKRASMRETKGLDPMASHTGCRSSKA